MGFGTTSSASTAGTRGVLPATPNAMHEISLLDLYLEEPGSTSVEFQFAKLLKQRAAPGDLVKALPHAQRATDGQDFSIPWILWIRLVREVEGLEAAITAARVAADHVAPSRNLYGVYQYLGAYLCQSGRPVEAVDALLEGAERADGSEQRIVEQTLYYSAAEPSISLLQLVRDWIGQREGFAPQLVLGDVLLHEHRGDWSRAAQAAQNGRKSYPTYFLLALHEALCWLGAGDPGNAQLPPLRYLPRGGHLWLAALVALHQGNLAGASKLLSSYLDASAPTTEAGIRASLLREWDHRIAPVGEPNPALTCPILPPSVTGLAVNILRPQYGPPVLPQHQNQPRRPAASQNGRVRILSRQSPEAASPGSTENIKIGEESASLLYVEGRVDGETRPAVAVVPQASTLNAIAPSMPARMSASTSSKKLLLFLHGLGGQATSTWGRFPEFLMADREMADRFAVGYYSYPTSLFRLPFSSRAPKVQELAAGLRN